MKVLVACEESQAVCKAFRELGHDAYSCDIQPCSGGHPEWHIQADARELLKLRWDLIIAHPPCTYMTNAGAVRMRVNGQIVQERYEKAMEAKAFFMRFLEADCPPHLRRESYAYETDWASALHAGDSSIPVWAPVFQTHMFVAERFAAARTYQNHRAS